MNIGSGAISTLPWNASEINEIAWVPGSGTGVMYINGTNDDIPGGVTLYLTDAASPNSTYVSTIVSRHTLQH